MKRVRRQPIAIFLSAIAAILACCGARSELVEPIPGLMSFTNARLITGNGDVIENGTMIVHNGRIDAVGPSDTVSVPPDAELFDATSKTIMPGLINAHGHVSNVRGLKANPAFYTEEHVAYQLRLYARYGVTTVFSLGGDGPAGTAVRDRQGPDLNRARLYVAGRVVDAGTPKEAVEQVTTVADSGADLIKIRVDDNLGATEKMLPEVYQAVIETTHARGLRLAAHLYYLDDAKDLLKAGTDLIAHSVRDAEVDDELIELLNQNDTCICPTLMREVSTFVYEKRPEWFDDPFFLRAADSDVVRALEAPEYQERIKNSRSAQKYKQALGMAQRNLKTLVDNGVGIAFGTDTGPAARFQGYFEHGELDLMVEAGLTPMQAIVSATGGAARCMQVDNELGTLAPGKWADFVVLGNNPLDHISNTRTIEAVWIAGNLVPGSGVN